jgi:hypothetical protein
MTTKPYEDDDPMELVGVALPEGNLDLFVESIVREYLLLGWSPRQIMLLFRKPFFAGTHAALTQMDEANIQQVVERLASEWSRGWLQRSDSNA